MPVKEVSCTLCSFLHMALEINIIPYFSYKKGVVIVYPFNINQVTSPKKLKTSSESGAFSYKRSGSDSEKGINRHFHIINLQQ